MIAAKTNNGSADKPKSHLQPRFGATAKARATSKQAPSAQKHCQKKFTLELLIQKNKREWFYSLKKLYTQFNLGKIFTQAESWLQNF